MARDGWETTDSRRCGGTVQDSASRFPCCSTKSLRNGGGYLPGVRVMRFSKRSCCFLAMLGSTDIQLSIYDKSDSVVTNFGPSHSIGHSGLCSVARVCRGFHFRFWISISKGLVFARWGGGGVGEWASLKDARGKNRLSATGHRFEPVG